MLLRCMYVGYENVGGRKGDMEWNMHNVSRWEFSKDDELSLYDGFVITGSCSDAYGNKKLICDLVTLIK